MLLGLAKADLEGRSEADPLVFVAASVAATPATFDTGGLGASAVVEVLA